MSSAESSEAAAGLDEVALERKRRREEKAKLKKAKAANSKQRIADKKKVTAQKVAPKSNIRLRNKDYVNPTPKGQKKQVSSKLDDMEKTYDVAQVEAAWYDWWKEQGYFAPPENPSPDAEKFVIIIPPPNVTGALHIGHALTQSIEDCVVRWHRMCGHTTLWIPGTDHAGIATQDIVEKKLLRETGKSRHDFSREEFVEKVWEWKAEYRNRIVNQLERLGISVDWSREFFTLDERLSRAVLESFVRMFEGGLIYRDIRLVNWCCKLNTAISDIEVNHKELEGPTDLPIPGYDPKKKYPFGVLVHFAYKVDGEDREVVVATTRIETMLGDTAVAVHPDDERYKDLHGKMLVHPFLDKKIPVITDSITVKMDFGTGAVKITPAHDPNDYQCGQRNNLEFINILTDDGLMNEVCPEPFRGMKRFDCRLAIIEALKEKDLFRGTSPNPMTIGVCSRTGDIIEPLIKPQWWIDCKDMARRAAEAVKTKELEIIPDFHITTWETYLEKNVRDWCISRQLYWGHRIPAYRITIDGKELEDTTKNWVAAKSEEEAIQKAAEKFAVDPSQITVSQDPDVLDTWYSSGLLPFSSVGWPDNTADFQSYFPNHLLETGHDILFFWVARMVMMSLQLTDKLPFKQVYLHAMVRDAFGKKMSKSKGNVIDPIDVIEGIALEDLHALLSKGNLDPQEVEKAIEGQKLNFPEGISECGTDAMRFALVSNSQAGKSINLNINEVVKYRNFCNKLWNATRFIMANLGEDYSPPASTTSQTGKELPIEKWILNQLNQCITNCQKGFTTYDFPLAANSIYSFIMDEVCAIYLESIKPICQSEDSPEKTSVRNTLYTCLETGFRLLHPFMPFITEELWQRLPRRDNDKDSIMISEYPQPVAAWENQLMQSQLETTMLAVREVRSMRSTYNIVPKNKLPVYVKVTEEAAREAIAVHANVVEVLGNSNSVVVLSDDAEQPKGCAIKVVNQHMVIYLELAGHGLDLSKELQKMVAKDKSLTQKLNSLLKQIEKPHYASSVPEKVQKEDQEKVAAFRQEIETTQAALQCLTQLVAES